jgi:hypothetical protein
MRPRRKRCVFLGRSQRGPSCVAAGMACRLHAPAGMPVPVDITFRAMSSSAAVEASIHRWADRLATTDPVQHCTVVVEIPHRHQRRRHTFHVRVEVEVPDRRITVSRTPGDEAAHENIYVAIADAFRAARRQLHDHAHVQRGDVKVHTAVSPREE